MYLGLKAANRLLPLPALRSYQKLHWRMTRGRLSGLRTELSKLYDPQAELTIVFPPSLDWSEQLFQRPQQMACALAKQGAQVFYFQHREHWKADAFSEIQPRLVLCSAPPEVFWELPGHGLFSYAMTWNCRLALAPNIEGIIYDHVDDLSVFPGNQARLASDHAALTRQARLVLATSAELHNEIKTLRPDALLCPNGVDYDHFARARQLQLEPPEELKKFLAEGKPLAGYIGALARWLDYSLLQETALKRPDWNFVLVGPDHDHTLPESCLGLPNLYWLGPKPYAVLPAYLQCFNTALIPFQLNPITHAASPLKLYEYMAAGKPVVSTPIQEAARTPGVLLAQDAGEFAAQLDQARTLNLDPSYLSQIDAVARQNTWDRRAKQIIEAFHLPTNSSSLRTGIITP